MWVPCEGYIHIPGKVSEAVGAQVASPRALLSVLRLLDSYPKGSQTSRSKEPRKNEGTDLIQYRKIAMAVVLSLFFQENNNKEEGKKKKKTLRSGSGIRNKSAKAEGIPNGKEARFPRLIRVL